MRSILVLLFVAVAFFATGEALKCYQCNFLHGGCGDAFEKSSEKEATCVTGSTHCIKVSAEYSNETIVLGRGCWKAISRSLAESAPSRAKELELLKETIYYCKSDLCNGAGAISIALSTLMVLVVPFAFAKLH